MSPQDALEKALSLFEGSPRLLAQAIGGDVKRQNVEHWIKAGRVPADQAPGVERATGGKTRCEALCPFVVWTRIPDRAWPWHPKGRPAIDVTKAEAA